MKILKPSEIAKAAALLQQGGLVAFPTETVYGLGASALDGNAVAKIYQAKGRPSFNPLIAHLANLEAVERIAHMPRKARDLAQAFWPGPLTLVLPKRGTDVSNLVTAGLDTIAVRVPDHPIALSLLAQVDVPLAAPSANLSGRVSPTEAAHVVTDLSNQIDAVLDGGATRIGLESTIVDCSKETPRLLRPGGLTLESIEDVIGALSFLKDSSMAPRSPGQLLSHYAPSALVRLEAKAPIRAEVMIGFGAIDGDLNLSPSGNLVEAAANLFGYLRQADEIALSNSTERIAIASIPNAGLGRAINDRLNRAAAPR
ncbi:MAG: L-threonylcarbamoyladenylate synthase [Pseudomonadota bacterium]